MRKVLTGFAPLVLLLRVEVVSPEPPAPFPHGTVAGAHRAEDTVVAVGQKAAGEPAVVVEEAAACLVPLTLAIVAPFTGTH